MQEVQALCDRVVIINKGTLVANDSVSNLTQSTTGEIHTFLSFSEKVSIDIFNDFEGIKHIESKPNNILCITYSSDLDLRNQLIKFCIEKELILTEIYSEEKKSIEDVFHTVTK